MDQPYFTIKLINFTIELVRSYKLVRISHLVKSVRIGREIALVKQSHFL